MHAYYWHIGDYHSHTSHLEPMEDLAYRRILDRYYLEEGPLKAPSSAVARAIGLTPYQEQVDYVLTTFFIEKGGFWVCKCADAYIKKYHDHKEASARGGRATKKVSENNKLQGPFKAPTKAPSSEGEGPCKQPVTSNHKPVTNKDLKTLEQSALARAHFETFWNSGMRKIGKKKTKPLFTKILKSRKEPPEEFVQMLCQDIQNRLNNNQLGFSEMHPTTYLNGERWTDENGASQSEAESDRLWKAMQSRSMQ